MFAKSVLTLAIVSALSATFSASASEDKQTEVIEVKGLRQKLAQDGRLMDVIQKTEVIDQAMIENKNALSLSDAIQNEPGVRVSNECSMCGVKRVMLNGMKGEHTTILVDGLPTHTLISGFYAVDAIATTGVDRIEVARGAGASLIAPEAIGGTINIVTKEAYDNQINLDFAKGSHDFTAAKLSATLVSSDGLTGLTLIGQYDKQDQEDHDDNGVSEAPFQENQSITAKLSHDLNGENNIQIRLSNVQSEVFGGPMEGQVINNFAEGFASYDGAESDHLFENDNVNDKFIGKAWETLEWIDTTRDEAYIKWLTEVNQDVVGEIAISYAKHHQDSFYEGIDYQAEDTMTYARVKFDWDLNNDHVITLGLDSKVEEMRSHSDQLVSVPDYVADSFDYKTQGAFIQDQWLLNDQLELMAAVRLDRVRADFVAPQKPGIEIEETIVAPRVDIRYFHNDKLTSRLSAGRGYRAPLSFFETDHGILDTEKGFLIDVDNLERSTSVTYSLSYIGDKLTSTFSVARSNVEHLAALEENEAGVPILTQLDNTASVSTFDLVAGYQLTDSFLINASLEKFVYDDVFATSYAVAPIEERASIEFNWNWHSLDFNWSTVWFGGRDLSRYGYDGFNVIDDANSKKPLDASAFSISNLRAKWQLLTTASVYFGVSNLFDITQIERGDSPLFFDAEGGYDVGYIYGPLHGREIYLGMTYDF